MNEAQIDVVTARIKAEYRKHGKQPYWEKVCAIKILKTLEEMENTMILIKINKNVEIELAKPTMEAYDKFAEVTYLKAFLGTDGMKSLRKQVEQKIKDKEYTIIKGK